MWQHLVLVPLISVFTGSLQPSSLASTLPYLDRSRLGTITVTDPQDVEQCETADCPLDIRSVSLRTYTGGTGRRMLAATVGAYELFDSLVEIANIKLRFDASGGPGPDWYVLMALTNLPTHIGWACGRSFGTQRYRMKVHGDLMTCLIPRRDLRPTKPIRFQALSRGNAYVVDRAPDEGWAG